jgi:superfamily I DNA and/or RNA helicase
LGGEALGLLADIERAIDAPLRQSRRGISAVMASYHAALAHAPNEAARAVREYASIVGATCQQSAGKAMSSLKELSDLEASEGIEFDTVVIDEAARANPLDLFVPMAMARRRIILVGDHRQLPHLVQRELEDELISRQSLTEAQAKAYEQSLFERLVKQLREQEKVDNIKRVVMLDTQYRMHPTLGDFISKQFYESEGLGVLHSGRPAQDFAHAIPGYQGKCAAWLDVPLQEGKEDRRGSSRIRLAEARAIAKEVKRIADTCGPTLSIGVISFYRAQCDLILEALVDQGLAEEEDGEIRIARSYRQTESGDERLRVGTVDGFQGKEFDVVFLSIVRANDAVVSNQKEGNERERLLNGKYGHLRLANRLNVAMSRQRKLLIAVGDKRMAEGPESEEAVPALTAFLKLCREELANGR